MNKAVFFDRDGVINIDKGYVHKWEDFTYIQDVLELIKHCKEKDYKLFVTTNQSGIFRGYYTKEDFLSLMDIMQNDLNMHLGVCFDEILFCPHAPNSNCECRKPKAGMLLKAISKYDINAKKSFIIGDKESDIEAGLNAGVKTILFNQDSSNNTSKAHHIVESLLQIKEIII